MDKDSKQVVVLLTHPNIKESRANKALMDAISDMGEVAIYNLYEMHVEDAFNAEIWSTIISHASALVFQFPFYWMSAPSLLKKWLDIDYFLFSSIHFFNIPDSSWQKAVNWLINRPDCDRRTTADISSEVSFSAFNRVFGSFI